MGEVFGRADYGKIAIREGSILKENLEATSASDEVRRPERWAVGFRSP